jgi:hypothetical protein
MKQYKQIRTGNPKYDSIEIRLWFQTDNILTAQLRDEIRFQLWNIPILSDIRNSLWKQLTNKL